MSLPREMFWAATVLEAANQQCGMSQRAAWTAADLRRESRILAAAEEEEGLSACSAPSTLSESALEEIRVLLLNGQWIHAIKCCREDTQIGLKEAHDFVRSLPEYQRWLEGGK